MPFRFEGAILGIDHGLKVIGLALSYSGALAKPYGLIHRTSKQADFAKIAKIIQKEHIQNIVLGLPPVPPDFVGFSQADKVRNWAGHLAQAIALPIYFWDEGLSSVDAEQHLRDIDQQVPERIDDHAAAVILQSCLDAVREGAIPTRFEPSHTDQDDAQSE